MINAIMIVVYLFLAGIFALALYSQLGNFAKIKENWRMRISGIFGAPLSERGVQKPEDVFEPGPNSLEAWERAGLMPDGVLPTIRRQHNLPGRVYLIQHPYLNTARLVKSVDALVAQIPFYGAEIEKRGGGTVEVRLIKQQIL